ncbi:MAG TPA: integrase core domain-containing protein [Puia sp.]|nr:integrase core domain-containing protein [Puia sp.]
MRINTNDKTLKNNYIQTYQFLIDEYELVKSRKHPTFKFVKDFYKSHGTCAQNFLKYYARYKQTRDIKDLLPGKRGPKYLTRRTPKEIEELVLLEREKGCNKFEINSILRPTLKDRTPSPSGVYQILKRYGKNRLIKPMVEEKRRIIKEKAGELAHIDCYHLSKDMIANDKNRYYLVSVIDSSTRIAWAEVVEDIKAISVMFTTLRCLNHITEKFSIKFSEVLTDNGPEFGPRESSQKNHHPFERMLIELGIKHRYIKPYRPQTNGKVERFWRTLNEDLIEGTYFESIDHFKEELFKYILYYNKLRPHQGLEGQIPEQVAIHQRNM